MKVVVVTLIATVLAMALGPVVCPTEGGPEPTSGQLASFIILATMTSLTFGLGVSFLIFRLPLMHRVAAGSKPRLWAMYLTIGWLLIS
jgi:hypothetical protein